jgi:hypothetical protein
VRINGSGHTFVLRRVVRQLPAKGRAKLTLRASGKALRAIRSALGKHWRVTAQVNVVGRDAAGNAGRAHRTVVATR